MSTGRTLNSKSWIPDYEPVPGQIVTLENSTQIAIFSLSWVDNEVTVKEFAQLKELRDQGVVRVLSKGDPQPGQIWLYGVYVNQNREIKLPDWLKKKLEPCKDVDLEIHITTF